MSGSSEFESISTTDYSDPQFTTLDKLYPEVTMRENFILQSSGDLFSGDEFEPMIYRFCESIAWCVFLLGDDDKAFLCNMLLSCSQETHETLKVTIKEYCARKHYKCQGELIEAGKNIQLILSGDPEACLESFASRYDKDFNQPEEWQWWKSLVANMRDNAVEHLEKVVHTVQGAMLDDMQPAFWQQRLDSLPGTNYAAMER